jgi:hypothetical protein
MLHVPTILFVALLATPIVLLWYLEYKLLDFQRDPSAVLWGFHGLRPDQYTDDGQVWLRRLWLVLVLLIPWWVLVALLLGKGQL